MSFGKMTLRTYCQPGWHLKEDWAKRLVDMDLWYVCSGRGTMRLRDRTITLRAGTCVWMRPGGLYQATQDLDHPLVVNAIHFDLHTPSGKRCDLDRLQIPEIFRVKAPTYFETATSHLIELLTPEKLHHGTLDVEAALLKAILMELLNQTDQQQLAGTELDHRDRMLQAASQIRKNLASKQSVAQLAKSCGYSEAHFSRTFRIVTGLSPQQYRVQERLTQACKLLVGSSYSIGQIADILGYTDVYFFSRQFKLKMGVSPKRYRDTEH